MSQVIPNHVLRVGQSVCMASKEDGGFRQPVHPRNISMTTKCSYYSSERCVGQVPAQFNGQVFTSTGVYTGEMNPPSRTAENVVHNQQNIHQAVYRDKGTTTNYPKQGTDTQVSDKGDPISPSLDISIDNLNQLILQLDPTFQPLTTTSDQVWSSAWDSSPSGPDATRPTSPTEIKCVQVNSKRTMCHENVQQSSSPTPKHEGILISRGAQRDNSTSNGSIIFCEANLHDRQRHPSNQATQGIPIPFHNSHHHDAILPASPESEIMQCHRPQFWTSELSMMSNSPGSDTSYILGSTNSLPNDEFDGQHFNSRSSESPCGSLGSFSNLNSPAVMTPTTPKYCFDNSPDIYCPNLSRSKTYHQCRTDKHTPTKGHANSCPPSVNNSTMDIPILLVNGCLQTEDNISKSSRNLLDLHKRKGSSSFNRVNKTASDSSIASNTDSPVKDGQPSMKFVMHTSKYWFKPSITREQAIEILKDKEPGSFIIRDSTSFRGSFGLAMKVPGMPLKAGEVKNDLVRHFLIESSSKGVHLKGASEEPYFGSLSALVYQHAITPLSLPCKLAIPTKDQQDGDNSPDSSPEATISQLKTTVACNVLYLNSVSTETLTGSSAIQKAVSVTFEKTNLPMPTIVHFKANEQGVTLTDVQRKVFFRRHYPISTLIFCGVDPELRKWQKHCRSSRIFGFIAKNPTDPSDNVCHLFAEYDVIQPASPLISFLTNQIQQQEKV
ncbi:tensin-4 [Bombina bombina]|uniref:tensin-4 n=1 Tax=Bombina bombina TaxID=8345 RepID=UPI00235A4B50|nr:tensin-4 [Bombina bombina]